jgi:predicted permease
VALAVGAVGALPRFAPDDVPGLAGTEVHGPVLAFAAGVSMLAAVLAALLPARQAAASRDVLPALRDGERGAAGGARASATRGVLVAAEMALATVLLIGACLLARSFGHLSATDLGFAPSGVLSGSVSLPDATYAEPHRVSAFLAQLVERVDARPGVDAAAAVFGLPLSGFRFGLSVEDVDGVPPSSPAEQESVAVRIVTPRYFEVMGIPLRGGRGLAASDTWDSPAVVLVNEAAARLLWDGRDPLGHRLHVGSSFGLGRGQVGGEVVGVVGNLRHAGPAAAPQPEVYFAYAQVPVGFATIVARTSGDPMALAGPLREEVAAIDPTIPLYDVRTMEHLHAASLARSRFYALLLGVFACTAAALAATGVYGMLAFLVARRTRELGLRLALGARPEAVLRLVLGQGLRLTAVGGAAGVVLALALGRVLSGLLHGVPASDAASYLAAACALAVVALGAAALPARRAARLDPALTLREE